MIRHVDKIMSISCGAFEASLAALDPHAKIDAAGHTSVICAGVTAQIQFAAMPARLLGGLLAMPQASVRITIPDATEAQTAAFLRRFDIAFQLGGG